MIINFEKNVLNTIEGKKNLLAFSGGGDSVALFHLLLEHNVDFSIAIVNYGIRKQSIEEVQYAQELSLKYNKKIYLYNAPTIENNFEATARNIRHDFFKEIIEREQYDNLLTGHNLGDRLEWFLMQLSKGSGLNGLLGMNSIDIQDNYSIIRPILNSDKSDLEDYLNINKIKFFYDETNSDEKYKRNEFRHNFSNPLLLKYKKGILNSFKYLEEDINDLIEKIDVIYLNDDNFYFYKKNTRSNLEAIDKFIKKKHNICISKHIKEDLKKSNNVLISRKILVSFFDDIVLITLLNPDNINSTTPIDKLSKNTYRIKKIDNRLRKDMFLDKSMEELILNII